MITRVSHRSVSWILWHIVGWWTAWCLLGWFTGRLRLRWGPALPRRALSAARRQRPPSGSGRQAGSSSSPGSSRREVLMHLAGTGPGSSSRSGAAPSPGPACSGRVSGFASSWTTRGGSRWLPPAPARVLRMLDDRARDSYLALGKQVTTAYTPDHDIWFRHRDERDLDAWFQLLPVLLPGVLCAARLRLG
jgi:hypothetical protein